MDTRQYDGSYKQKTTEVDKNMSEGNFQNSLASFVTYIEKLIQNDWQLQASIVGMCVLTVLIVLIKAEWAKHEPNLANLHRRGTSSQQYRAVSDLQFMKYDSFDKYDYERIQQYPDEDPLTFVKKSN